MNTKQLLSKLNIALVLFFLSIAACKKDEDVIPQPSITDFEIGYENSKVVTRGSDLHLEAEILAPGTIANIKIEIRTSTTSGWTYDQTFTEGYEGTKNSEFHEHIDVPASAGLGNYQIRIIVTDKNGRSSTAESQLTIQEKKTSTALIFTEVSGSETSLHGDHFHGLASGVEGASDTITFDASGNIISNGHIHLVPEKIYKIALKTYDASGNETQNKYIANQATAANYKAFLIGGNFILNTNTIDESGAAFQTRETQYADGTAVSGATNTTGVITYFTVGHANEGEKEVSFIMRKLNEGVKANITRVDWNRADYATAFAGTNELELKFEIHAEDEHGH